MGQFVLHESERPINVHALHYDCLYYRKQTVKESYQHLVDIVDDLIPYCVRPVDVVDAADSDFVDGHGVRMTFADIRLQHVTASDRLDCSVPMDINTIDDHDAVNEHFYNCTQPWFGHRCQYSFGHGRGSSFNEIVEQDFARRSSFVGSTGMSSPLPCYVLLQCDRGGSSFCLDWREICDGTVDCLDGGRDEEFCFAMELNECDENEYRCHNGLCIPRDLWENGLSDADCLDGSDDPLAMDFMSECYRDPSFRCEEHSCRPDLFTFACGDGECVMTLEACQNGRHAMLRQSMSAKGHLGEKCWMSMVCLTHLMSEVNGMACETLLSDDRSGEYE